MEFLTRSQDFQIILWIPLALITLKGLKDEWRKLWDNDLTIADRKTLWRLNILFLLPLTVLVHELGHAIAAIAFGGTVEELHLGIWWGYVTPSGSFTPLQDLIIALAGSAVQTVIGILTLAAALFVSSPPVVTLLVYAGMSSIAGTMIIYPLMSAVGAYGDWVAIYGSSEKSAVIAVAVCHVMLIGLFFFAVFSKPTRVWYTGKTRPKWRKDYRAALDRVAKEPSAINYLNLAWSYYLVDMKAQCRKTIAIVEKKDPKLVERWFLVGCLERNSGNIDRAVESFEKIVRAPNADDVVRVRALMAEGHCLSDKADFDCQDGKTDKNAAYARPLAIFEEAAALKPELADPLFFKASVLNKVELHKDAEKLLKSLDQYQWLDPTLKASVPHELKVARKPESSNE
ncbi:MAG: hypothetical protein IPM23_15930 [Candidatus Melainabacteria bacterium]|nr:hypothetical protein [Candidatus Melainabacteria bacterium]